MEFQGKIIEVLPVRSGVSKSSGNDWKAQQYVIESHGEYPRKMCFEVFGADRISQFNIQAGEELTVSFDIDAHQWQDKWFNSVRAWKVDRTPAAAAAAAPSAAAPQPQQQTPFPPAPEADPFASTASADGNDDLPF